MKRRNKHTSDRLDWVIILIYATLVAIGWLSIYASVYDGTKEQTILDLSLNSGRQLLFIIAGSGLILGIIVLDVGFYEFFAYLIFALTLVLVLLTLFIGKEVGGNKAWIGIGSLGIQPSEFAKLATALAISKFVGSVGFKMNNWRNQLMLFIFIALPIGIILLQKDAGTALVFTIFILVFFREGMSPFLMIVGVAIILIVILTLLVPNQLYLHGGVILATLLYIFLGRKKTKHIITIVVGAILVIGTIESTDYIIADVLKPHQQNRIKALINPSADPLGYGWNVTQSKIAIGSGGFFGKGFLKGTQTKFDFVPEQSTDFIFCTIGEEYGWIGSFVIIILFTILLFRILFIAERQKNRFARAYGYSVAGILFFHFAINIGMTIGLFPVIGIPLPFISYGGSSLWGNSMMLFILLKIDAHRGQMLQRL